MRRVGLTIVPLLIVCFLALAACGSWTTTGGTGIAGPNTISLGASNFDQDAITIKTGTALVFDDTNGAFHLLCLGKDQQCDASASGPKDLENGGFSINAGQTRGVTFDTPGTYEITCTVHPDMNLTVTVQ